jgi:hypothetical protein
METIPKIFPIITNFHNERDEAYGFLNAGIERRKRGKKKMIKTNLAIPCLCTHFLGYYCSLKSLFFSCCQGWSAYKSFTSQLKVSECEKSLVLELVLPITFENNNDRETQI